MKLRNILGAYFGRKAKEPHPYERISEFGLKLLSDKKLMERISLVDLLHQEFDKPIEQVLGEDEGIPVEEQTPLDRLRVSRSRLNVLNRLMKVASVPYARAGDQSAYRQMMLGWEELYSLSLDLIATAESILKSASEENVVKKILSVEANADANEKTLMTLKINIAELVRKLESFLNIEVYAYGFMIMDSAYFDRDVAASYASVIMTLPTGTRPLTTLQVPRSFEESSEEALDRRQLPGPPPVQDWGGKREDGDEE